MEMMKQGLRNISPGDITWEARKGAVEYLLLKNASNKPGIIMNEAQSPILARGFKGGYMYPDSAGEIEPTKLRPLKNEYSHPHDALQYVCGAVKRNIVDTHDIEIPSPRYGFQHTKHNDEAVNG